MMRYIYVDGELAATCLNNQAVLDWLIEHKEEICCPHTWEVRK